MIKNPIIKKAFEWQKHLIKEILKLFVVLGGGKNINISRNLEYFNSFVIYRNVNPKFYLPSLTKNISKVTDCVEDGQVISNLPNYLWKIEEGTKIKSINIARSGGIIVNNNLYLDLGFGCAGSYLNNLLYKKTVVENTCFVPWTYFWGGYYEFVINILPKFCQLEEVYGPSIWSNINICYPLHKIPYEMQFLNSFNVKDNILIDTRLLKNKIRTKKVIFGNYTNWFFPSANDINLLRRKYLKSMDQLPSKKLYLSRKNRRVVVNENQLFSILEKEGFEFIEDFPMNVDDQIKLFSSAKFIVAPHGGALTNLIWCCPGTYVVELFAQGYAPQYYQYISKVLGFSYYSLINNPTNLKEHYSNKFLDIEVDLGEFQTLFNAINSTLTD